ncbi:MAG: 2OG-Fe(II) oxygenase, partial [Bacteroidota bacterium]
MAQVRNPFEKIADDIAEKGVAVVDGFLGDEAVDAIRSLDLLQDDIHRLKRAGIGKENRQINEGIRGDHIHWIDRSSAPEPLKLYLAQLDELRQFLNQSLFLSMKDQEVHIARYPAGAFYKRHLDQFKKDDHRRLSVICYLNTNWKEEEGGQLRIYLEGGSEDVLPVAGRLVCFRRDLLEHEVLPAPR